MSDPVGPGGIRTNIRGHVGFLLLGQSHKRNTISSQMWASLPDALDALCHHDGVRVVVIEGDGPNFGRSNLSDLLHATENEAAARAYCTAVAQAVAAVTTCCLPTIAGMRGVAIGAAAELALAADVRIGDASATLVLPFLKTGLVPSRVTLLRLQALVGPSAARGVLFNCEPIGAEQALAMGLIDRMVELGQLSQEITALSASWSTLSLAAVAATKRALLEVEMAGDAATLTNIEASVRSMTTGDTRHGVEALLQKFPFLAE